jgi:hypothetical protein
VVPASNASEAAHSPARYRIPRPATSSLARWTVYRDQAITKLKAKIAPPSFLA